MKIFTISLLAFGTIFSSAFAHSAQTSTLKIVGAGISKGGEFIAIVQNENQSLIPMMAICSAGTHYALGSGNEKIMFSNREYKGYLRSADMTGLECEFKLESMRTATLQDPIFIAVNPENQ